jgi:hypothetical protein
VKVDDIPFTTAHEGSEPQRPSPITTLKAQTVRSHTSLLKFLGEMIFVGQHKSTLDVEPVVIVSLSGCTQQTLRTTRAETLDDPEDPNTTLEL